MHMQVCAMHDKLVLGFVLFKHKKKFEEAVNVSDQASVCAWNPHVSDGWVSVVVLTCQVWVCDTLWRSMVLQVYN